MWCDYRRNGCNRQLVHHLCKVLDQSNLLQYLILVRSMANLLHVACVICTYIQKLCRATFLLQSLRLCIHQQLFYREVQHQYMPRMLHLWILMCLNWVFLCLDFAMVNRLWQPRWVVRLDIPKKGSMVQPSLSARDLRLCLVIRLIIKKFG